MAGPTVAHSRGERLEDRSTAAAANLFADRFDRLRAGAAMLPSTVSILTATIRHSIIILRRLSGVAGRHAVLLTPQKSGSGALVTPARLVRHACIC
jgi:hypothetical protein